MKPDGDADKAPNAKKKKKDEPSQKGVKPKEPVDVERQCGVPLPNGGFCARSLTCKSHSMGTKRAVPGRSLPYDMLLVQYQKKNQAKQERKRPRSPNDLEGFRAKVKYTISEDLTGDDVARRKAQFVALERRCRPKFNFLEFRS